MIQYNVLSRTKRIYLLTNSLIRYDAVVNCLFIKLAREKKIIGFNYVAYFVSICYYCCYCHPRYCRRQLTQLLLKLPSITVVYSELVLTLEGNAKTRDRMIEWSTNARCWSRTTTFILLIKKIASEFSFEKDEYVHVFVKL